ncbi:hypothetical protein BG011_009935 [Mortierella polycephala]|uniref:Uncharacterized protein n=1 Tax=Mortierella polycephala TaxID=41804 RepID=A0A9P6TVS2_9FUNG|nr:hypothetical protein BG011_009935 [Mortierella polycephala]
MGNMHNLNLQFFERLIRKATRITCLDTDLSNEEVDILRSMRSDVHVINNTFQQQKDDKNASESAKRDIIKNINTFMADLDYFIHTPTISVGVDYNVKDHVDYVVGIFSTHSEVDVETCIQMMRRVRHNKSKAYLVYADAASNNLPTTIQGVKDWICNQRGLIIGKVRGSPTLRLQLDDDNKLGIPDDLYHRMYCYVKAKKHLSMNGFRSRLIQQMTRAGCVVKGQRASVYKHTLMRSYDVKSHDIVTATWVETYDNRREKEIYKNLVALSTDVGPSLQECLRVVKQREDLGLHHSVRGAPSVEAHSKVERSQYVKLEFLVGIMVACGYEDTIATDEVLAKDLKERIDGIWADLESKMSDICTSIKKRKPTSNNWAFKNKLAFVNMVLYEVLGVKIKTDKSNKRRTRYSLKHHSNVGSAENSPLSRFVDA